MYFDLSKPQKLLQQSVRDFCKRECPMERVREIIATDSGITDQLWGEFADQGWLGLHLDESVDGLGLGLVELAVVAEELGRGCVPGPWLSANWAATLLADAGGDTASELVPKIVDGSVQATVAACENQSSWNASAEYLNSVLSDDGARLSGGKNLVMHAAGSQWIVILARKGDQLCLVLVPSDAGGVLINEAPGIDITRKTFQCDFDNVAIAPEYVLATGSAAEDAWQRSQNVMLVAVAAEMLGMMQWMIEATVEYAKTRKQFDQMIGSFQAVQTKCADMLLMTESARSVVWNAAWALQEGEPNAAHACSVAKAYTSEAAREVGNRAIQSHGGIGFTWEHDLHLYYKRVRADEFLLGDATLHRERIAEHVFA